MKHDLDVGIAARYCSIGTYPARYNGNIGLHVFSKLYMMVLTPLLPKELTTLIDFICPVSARLPLLLIRIEAGNVQWEIDFVQLLKENKVGTHVLLSCRYE